ncbi:class I SAM-dependent methyltransferase [Desulfotomaculum nigrificans]|nr:methyltransferase domain-containing protein [Desulfotomaculum nigrificans]
MEPKPGTSLLDIGCGTGNYFPDLARQGLKVTGVDIPRVCLRGVS